jgi:Cu+-exporting ATPase
MARDPVCGMDVNEQQAAGTSEYQGQIYYFCSSNCKQQFDQNPQRYASEGTTQR